MANETPDMHEESVSLSERHSSHKVELIPPYPQLIGLGLFFFGTLGIIYAGYVHGKMHLLTTLKNAKEFYG